MAAARWLFALAACTALPGPLLAAQAAPRDFCARPPPGSAIPEPEDLRSRHGVLKLDLTVHNYRESDGSIRYCYVLADGAQSPTLRVNPGDLLILRLKNDLRSFESGAAPHTHDHGDAVKPAGPLLPAAACRSPPPICTFTA